MAGNETAVEKTNFKTERRLGTFFVGSELLHDYPEFVATVLAGMVIVRAEFIFHVDAIEYQAYSPRFEPAKFTTHPPRYRLDVKTEPVERVLHSDSGDYKYAEQVPVDFEFVQC